MGVSNVIDISRFRQIEEQPKGKIRRRQRGSVQARGAKLWLGFYYFGKKVREPSGLSDTPQNKKLLRKRMDLIMAEIDNGRFEFCAWFPQSRRREFFAELEGRNAVIDPGEVVFKEYVEKWVAGNVSWDEHEQDPRL